MCEIVPSWVAAPEYLLSGSDFWFQIRAGQCCGQGE